MMGAVADAAKVALKPILATLAALLADESKRFEALKFFTDIKSVTNDLTAVEAFLLKMSEDSAVLDRAWLDELLHYSYDTEDTIDNFFVNFWTSEYNPYSGTFSKFTKPTNFGVTTRSPDLRVSSNLETVRQEQSSIPHDIPLQYLKEITDNFSDERILGQGGSGVVYKGVRRNGEMIAVKRIVSPLMSGPRKQFESEVHHLMTLKHRNIVQCLGYCYEIHNVCSEYNGKYVFAEMAERLLCLEYLPKGSLDKYISDESSGLNWCTRYKIIKGICYGLCHLHELIDKPIIHLDLKSANILLDSCMLPKITDFGLSRLLDQQTICTSSRLGTLGYMAPEYLLRGTVTPMVDIFSLGVIIMEVVTGHRDYPDVTRTPSDDFIELTLEKWRNVLQRSTEYGSLGKYCEQVKRCLQVGLSCVNPDRTKRPTIGKVICMLLGFESIDCYISNEATSSAGQL